MKTKYVLTGFAFVAVGMLSAATLNVELTVTHGIESSIGIKEQNRIQRVAYFVVDRSGSMDYGSLEGNRKPNDALLESLKMRLDSLPDGSAVHVIPFSSMVKTMMSYPSLDRRARAQIMDFVVKDKPKGMTLLYDAQDMALTEAARTMQRNPGADISVYVYTDGKQETPTDYEGEYPARPQLRKKTGRGFMMNPDYIREKEDAYAKLKAKFADMVSRPNLEVEYEWLSRSQPPDTENWGTKPRIGTELSSQTHSLKNPRTEPEQTIRCSFYVPVTESCWNEINGKPFALEFDVGGKRCSRALTLKDGKTSLKIDWPALPSDRPATARLAISHLPSGKKFDLKDSRPLELNVPAQGRVSVAVESPSGNAVVPVGANVRFAARASETANVKWTIGGSALSGAQVTWAARAPGRVDYSVTASKQGFLEATAKGVLEVIPAGVEIACTSDRHEVGKPSIFQAKAVGPCLRYAWTVDGRRIPGETGTLKYDFKDEKPGAHKIGVTAMYKAGITKDAVRDITLAAAPFVKILSPVAYDGDSESAQYQAKKPIELSARVDGDLATVEWQFKGKDNTLKCVMDVKNGQVSGCYTLPKGGYYDVLATAKGPAGEKSATVQMFVKSAEVGVRIESPKPNQEVETGKEFEMSASAKGPVKSIKWTVVNQSTAQAVKFGPSDISSVAEGKPAVILAKLPLEVGNASLVISAEPIVDDAELAETVEPHTITVIAKTDASVAYTQETLSQNWKRVKCGSQVTLGVVTSGAVKKESVAWFTVGADGKTAERLKQTGESINVDIPDVRGQSECNFDYWAMGQRPDGGWASASGGQRITIRGCCPCVFAEAAERPCIELPRTNGVVRASFGLTDAVRVSLGPKTMYEVKDVIWEMGDGTVYTNRGASTEHLYKSYGEYTIRAFGHCARCGSSFDATAQSTVVIEPQPITAEFAVRPSATSSKSISGSVSQGRQVVLVGMDSPDIARREWTCNGVLLKDENGKPMTGATIEFRCMDVGDVEFGLTVFDSKGNAVGPMTHKLRVYRLWVVILAFLFALVVAGFFWWYFSGDVPRFWKISVRVDETNRMDAQAVEADMASGPGLARYWDTMRNRATIPLNKLGGKQSEDWSVGTVLGQTSLMIWESKTAADDRGVRMPNCSLLNPPDGMEKESLSKGQLIHIWAPSPSNPKAVTALWVKIKMRAAPNTYLWLRLGILLLCLGLAVAVSCFFAF